MKTDTAKTRIINLQIGLFLALSYCCHHAMASDAAVEKLWSDELVDIYTEQEAIFLDAGGKKFLTLYNQDVTGTLQGGAILLHSLGAHPDWPEVISPLRKSLPQYGWSTLSIQMPVLNKKAKFPDYNPLFDEVPERINAAVSHFQEQGIQNIVLIGHGLGAVMGASYLANLEESKIKGFIGISMIAHSDMAPNMYSPALLETMTLPVLDVYGSRDLLNITKSSKARANAARKSGSSASQRNQLSPFQQSATAQAAITKKPGFIAFRQFEITGADHSFVGFESILTKRIVGWLKHHAGGITLPAS